MKHSTLKFAIQTLLITNYLTLEKISRVFEVFSIYKKKHESIEVKYVYVFILLYAMNKLNHREINYMLTKK